MSNLSEQVLFGQEPEAKAFMQALGLNSDLVYRVVVDIKADAVTIAYIETYASKKAIEILTNQPKGIEVRLVDEAES